MGQNNMRLRFIADIELKHAHCAHMRLVHYGAMSAQNISEEAQARHVRLQEETHRDAA